MNNIAQVIDENWENFFCFDFSEEVCSTSLFKCAECGEWVPALEWKHVDNYCEICGDHAALMCPKCEQIFDSVFDDETIEVRNV